jgi:hypothetical protein
VLKLILQELFDGDDFDEYWGPRDMLWEPPGWKDEPLKPKPKLSLASGNQQPWPVCPECKESPEALYIDCREAHMLLRYNDPVSGQPVPVLPITFPFPKRIATPDVHSNWDKRKSILKGAPKLVEKSPLRGVLKQWSGHVPVKKHFVKGKVVEVAAPSPAPLDAANVEVSQAELSSAFIA